MASDVTIASCNSSNKALSIWCYVPPQDTSKNAKTCPKCSNQDNINTCPQFWRMIEQEKVSTIVMLCMVQKGFTGCSQYFPPGLDDDSSSSGDNNKVFFLLIFMIIKIHYWTTPIRSYYKVMETWKLQTYPQKILMKDLQSESSSWLDCQVCFCICCRIAGSNCILFSRWKENCETHALQTLAQLWCGRKCFSTVQLCPSCPSKSSKRWRSSCCSL